MTETDTKHVATLTKARNLLDNLVRLDMMTRDLADRLKVAADRAIGAIAGARIDRQDHSRSEVVAADRAAADTLDAAAPFVEQLRGVWPADADELAAALERGRVALRTRALLEQGR